MRKKLLLLAVLAAAVIASLSAPRVVQAGPNPFICDYFCLDPELTCCITCYRVGSQCLCPEYCTVE